ncbi:MAG: glycosyltransferase, partial [Phycisphaeraceae bacterium]
MKILHLITRLILGGAQENTLLSCEGQAAAGHEVTLAFGPIYGPEGSLLERAQGGGYELAELSAMIRAVRPWTDVRCYYQVRKLIRELKPDVVHTHSSKAGIIGRAAAWAEGVPAVVHTIHG